MPSQSNNKKTYIIRIDWTNHGYTDHSNPHIHITIYDSQYPDGKTVRWD